MDEVRIGVIGVGGIARNYHLPPTRYRLSGAVAASRR